MRCGGGYSISVLAFSFHFGSYILYPFPFLVTRIHGLPFLVRLLLLLSSKLMNFSVITAVTPSVPAHLPVTSAETATTVTQTHASPAAGAASVV